MSPEKKTPHSSGVLSFKICAGYAPLETATATIAASLAALIRIGRA